MMQLWMVKGTANKILFTNMLPVQCFSEVLIIEVNLHFFISHVHADSMERYAILIVPFSNSFPVSYSLLCFIKVNFSIFPNSFLSILVLFPHHLIKNKNWTSSRNRISLKSRFPAIIRNLFIRIQALPILISLIERKRFLPLLS